MDISAIPVLAPEEPRSPATASARLEAYVGVIVAAAAAALGAALAEKFEGDTVSAPTKKVGGETIAELLKLYFLLATKIDFNRIGRERGVETLMGNNIPLEVASFWVDEVLKILAAVTRRQLN